MSETDDKHCLFFDALGNGPSDVRLIERPIREVVEDGKIPGGRTNDNNRPPRGTMPPKKNAKPRFVIVATKSRPWSVVAGTVESEDGDTITLTNARMVLYWVADVHGLYGLAANGTPRGSRVSPPARVRISGVEHVIDATDDARKSIEAEPWA